MRASASSNRSRIRRAPITAGAWACALEYLCDAANSAAVLPRNWRFDNARSERSNLSSCLFSNNRRARKQLTGVGYNSAEALGSTAIVASWRHPDGPACPATLSRPDAKKLHGALPEVVLRTVYQRAGTTASAFTCKVSEMVNFRRVMWLPSISARGPLVAARCSLR